MAFQPIYALWYTFANLAVSLIINILITRPPNEQGQLPPPIITWQLLRFLMIQHANQENVKLYPRVKYKRRIKRYYKMYQYTQMSIACCKYLHRLSAGRYTVNVGGNILSAWPLSLFQFSYETSSYVISRLQLIHLRTQKIKFRSNAAFH